MITTIFTYMLIGQVLNILAMIVEFTMGIFVKPNYWRFVIWPFFWPLMLPVAILGFYIYKTQPEYALKVDDIVRKANKIDD